MKKRISLFLVGLLAISSMPALASWQFTSWGMTAQQAVLASKGKITLSSGRPGQRIEGLTVGAVGQYVSGSRIFESTFYFKNSELAIVMLETVESNRCSSLANDLKGVYGVPFESTKNSITILNTWQDRKGNNFIALLAIGDNCSLSYKPLVSPDAVGL